MPFVPVDRTALVELRFEAQGQQIENTLWFKGDDPIDPSSLTDIANAVHDWWFDNIRMLQSVNVVLRETVATDQTVDSGPQVAIAGDVLDVGGNTPNIYALGSTFVVSFRTLKRGRSFRGRNYVIGLTEDNVDGNSLVDGVSELWRVAYVQLITAATDVGFTWVVASRFHGVSGTPPRPTPRPAGVVTPITSVVVVDQFIDSQRRRLSGRGR